MKKFMHVMLIALTINLAFISCREQTEKEKLVDEMEDAGAEIEKKVDGDKSKIKMETEDKKVKIKEEDGETKIKIKTDDN